MDELNNDKISLEEDLKLLATENTNTAHAISNEQQEKIDAMKKKLNDTLEQVGYMKSQLEYKDNEMIALKGKVDEKEGEILELKEELDRKGEFQFCFSVCCAIHNYVRILLWCVCEVSHHLYYLGRTYEIFSSYSNTY